MKTIEVSHHINDGSESLMLNSDVQSSGIHEDIVEGDQANLLSRSEEKKSSVEEQLESCYKPEVILNENLSSC